ncbi:MAG: SPFH domain-containing protein [Clostridia bacterium]|nr:SPFH domain-containing protein [Clostridia bacterium]
MGLIRAALNAGGTVLADQWKEYFQVDAMSNEQLVVKAHKQTRGNNRGGDDIISNGSVVAVGDGQVALIVEDGKIVEFCAEPGRFIWDASSEPSMFCGGFFKGLADSFKKFGERFTFGGDRAKTQRVYFVNTKEVMNNKFGTTTPMVYDDPYYGTALYIRYFGQFSFRITDPIIFFTSIAGSVADSYSRDSLMDMCKDEFMTALDSTLAMLSADGVKFSQIPMKQREIAKYMSSTLDEEWVQRRGMDVVAVAIAKVTPDDNSRKRIEEFDTNVMHSNPNAMAGGMAYAQMQAMQKAASNSAGAMTGFMGLGMMGNAMNNNAQSQNTLLQTAQNLRGGVAASPAPSPAAPAGSWRCACGATNTGRFCSECGERKPEPVAEGLWTCSCGARNTGRFCADCGARKPEGYACSCGYTSPNPFRFCPECGSRRE